MLLVKLQRDGRGTGRSTGGYLPPGETRWKSLASTTFWWWLDSYICVCVFFSCCLYPILLLVEIDHINAKKIRDAAVAV